MGLEGQEGEQSEGRVGRCRRRVTVGKVRMCEWEVTGKRRGSEREKREDAGEERGKRKRVREWGILKKEVKGRKRNKQTKSIM